MPWCARDTLTGHGDGTAADQAEIRDMVVRRATRAGGDDGGAGAGAAGDAIHSRGLEAFSQTHRWQDGGQPACQPRLPHPRWPQEEEVMVRTPACRSASPLPAREHKGLAVNPCSQQKEQ